MKTVHSSAHRDQRKTEQLDRGFPKRKMKRHLYTNHQIQQSKQLQVSKKETENCLPIQDQHHIRKQVARNPHKTISGRSIEVDKKYSFRSGAQCYSMAVPTPPMQII